jgi:hypothetical protein
LTVTLPATPEHLLVLAAVGSKMHHHRQQEQQQVDTLLASQKHLTSNLRTLINSE